jgi:hypothetical protein
MAYGGNLQVLLLVVLLLLLLMVLLVLRMVMLVMLLLEVQLVPPMRSWRRRLWYTGCSGL